MDAFWTALPGILSAVGVLYTIIMASRDRKETREKLAVIGHQTDGVLQTVAALAEAKGAAAGADAQRTTNAALVDARRAQTDELLAAMPEQIPAGGDPPSVPTQASALLARTLRVESAKIIAAMPAQTAEIIDKVPAETAKLLTEAKALEALNPPPKSS